MGGGVFRCSSDTKASCLGHLPEKSRSHSRVRPVSSTDPSCSFANPAEVLPHSKTSASANPRISIHQAVDVRTHCTQACAFLYRIKMCCRTVSHAQKRYLCLVLTHNGRLGAYSTTYFSQDRGYCYGFCIHSLD